MRRILFAGVLSVVASDALAISRYDITNMSCTEVQAVIQKDGEAILRYGSSDFLGLPVYDRYVSEQKFCESGEVLARTGVPTTDKKYCVVHKCIESSTFVAR